MPNDTVAALPPLTYSVEAASQRLGAETFTVDWFRSHLHELPHIKTGKGRGRSGRIAFTEAHLIAILTMFSVTPEPGTDPGEFTPVSRRGPRRRAS